ncbi:hypothetical protein RN001_001440 [Aquatica leii]|uniref:NADH-ubiquinone oxidoreductase 15 kDa subunit n=1 Tax=Aquatica leii TaxID=1421715 RepID=A0AAN7Q424_9COLE|nr:hypothetical protein RN001_001440 [Aquatica leii]
MSTSPVFRSPFTDLTGCLISHQWHGPCRDFEMKVMDCLEAYGLHNGRIKCDTLIKDFRECAGRRKQDGRVIAMRNERLRQIKSGELSKENAFIPIEPDSY